MNPTTERGPMQLPTPMTPASLPGAVTAAPERAGLGVEAFPSPTGVAPAIPAIPLPVPTAATPMTPVNLANNSIDGSTPAVADDIDLIEKEWVHKAKAIIEHTQNDPHQKSKELSIFKADYMQKRYNKALRLSE
jgi:hypothetical protein